MRRTHDSVRKARLGDLDRLSLALEAHDQLVRRAEVHTVNLPIRSINNDLLPPLSDILLARDLVVVSEVLKAVDRDVGGRNALRKAEVGVESGLEGESGDGGGGVLDVKGEDEGVRAEVDGVGQGEGELEDRLDSLGGGQLCTEMPSAVHSS